MKISLFIVFLATFICEGCTLFQKNQASNEMEALTKDVLKDKNSEGIEIDVRKFPGEKK